MKDDCTEIDVVYRSLNVLHPYYFRFLNFASSLGKGEALKGDEEFSSKVKNHYFSEMNVLRRC